MSDLEVLSGINPTTSDCKKLIPTLKSLFESMDMKFEEKLDQFTQNFFDKLKQKDEQIAELRSEVSSLKTIVHKLEDQLDDNDAYERRDTLIFSGSSLPTANENENCAEIIRNLAQEKLRIILPQDGISACHRLGTKSSTQRPDNRPIITKFCQRNVKTDVLMAARKLRSPQIFVNESLTPPRQTIFYVLRKAKKEFPGLISGCSTRDGRVYAWLKPPREDARPIRRPINNRKDLEDFCQRTLNKELSHFTNWTH